VPLAVDPYTLTPRSDPKRPLSAYGYVDNNPQNGTDPTGLVCAQLASARGNPCRGRPSDYVLDMWQAPDNHGSIVNVTFECGKAGPHGWGLRHILNPEPGRTHFRGIYSAYLVQALRDTLQRPVLSPGGAWPELQKKQGTLRYDGTYTSVDYGVNDIRAITVIVDPVLMTVKTAWDNPSSPWSADTKSHFPIPPQNPPWR
jgi:hypothetical protein